MRSVRIPRLPAVACALAVLIVVAGAAAAAPSISGTRAEIEDLGRQVATLDVRVGTAVAEHNAAIDSLEEAESALAETARRMRATRRDLVTADRLLSERLVAVYVSDDPSLLEVLLTTGSVADVLAAGAALDRVARRDAAVVDALRVRRARLGTLRQKWSDARRARQDRVAAAAARRTEVAAALAERERLLAGARAELRRLVKAEKERRRRLAALERARRASLTNSLPVSGGTPVVGSLPAGEYLFPVAGATRFTNDWMFGRPGGRLHQGIDLFASHGTPVVAVADGSLFNVGYNGLGGWRLWVRADTGTTFYYAHLSGYSAASSEGARVSRGTVLGYVGTSGDARGTSPHLHFEVHPGGGGPVPPFPIVSAWPRAG